MQFEERRHHPRVGTDCAVLYRVIPPVRPDFQGAHLRDYSAGGVRFRTLAYLRRGARMLLELRMPSGPPIRAVGTAAWVRVLPEGSGYEVGGQFDVPDDLLHSAADVPPVPHGNA